MCGLTFFLKTQANPTYLKMTFSKPNPTRPDPSFKTWPNPMQHDSAQLVCINKKKRKIRKKTIGSRWLAVIKFSIVTLCCKLWYLNNPLLITTKFFNLSRGKHIRSGRVCSGRVECYRVSRTPLVRTNYWKTLHFVSSMVVADNFSQFSCLNLFATTSCHCRLLGIRR